MTNRPCLRVGVGGPVGSGKTALLRHLCMRLRKHYNMAVVTIEDLVAYRLEHERKAS